MVIIKVIKLIFNMYLTILFHAYYHTTCKAIINFSICFECLILYLNSLNMIYADCFQELVDDFVFTASKVLLQCRKNQGDIQQLDQAVPVCQSPSTVMATFELLIGLVTGCLQNMRSLADMLSAMFYTGELYFKFL